MEKIVAALTDLSFKKFVTPSMVTYIYIVGIVFSVVASLSLFAMPLGYVLAPVSLVTSVIFLRCGLELVLAVFQVARYTAEIARRGRPAGGAEMAADEIPMPK